MKDLRLLVSGGGLVPTIQKVPLIQPFSVRKVGFQLKGPAPDIKGVKAAGFFGNDWSVEKGEFVFIND